MIVLRNTLAQSELKTPPGVKSFSLGCSAAEPKETNNLSFKPLAGDTNPREHETKPIVSPLRGSSLFFEPFLGFSYAAPQAKVSPPCGV